MDSPACASVNKSFASPFVLSGWTHLFAWGMMEMNQKGIALVGGSRAGKRPPSYPYYH